MGEKDGENMVKASHALDRVLVLEMVRVTEAAAVAASKLIGREPPGSPAFVAARSSG